MTRFYVLDNGVHSYTRMNSYTLFDNYEKLKTDIVCLSGRMERLAFGCNFSFDVPSNLERYKEVSFAAFNEGLFMRKRLAYFSKGDKLFHVAAPEIELNAKGKPLLTLNNLEIAAEVEGWNSYLCGSRKCPSIGIWSDSNECWFYFNDTGKTRNGYSLAEYSGRTSRTSKKKGTAFKKEVLATLELALEPVSTSVLVLV